MADDLKRTLREVKRAGWTITRRGGHNILDGPDGQRVVTCASPAGGRAHQNMLSQLKRAGLDLRKHRQRRGKHRPEETT